MPGRSRPRSANPHASAGRQGDHAHRLLEGELLAVAHPVAEQVGVDRRVGDLAEVGAGVGEGHHRPRVAQGAQQDLLVLRVEARLDEQLVDVGLDAEVDHRLGRVHAAPRGRRRRPSGSGAGRARRRGCPRSRAAGPGRPTPCHCRVVAVRPRRRRRAGAARGRASAASCSSTRQRPQVGATPGAGRTAGGS